MSGRSVRPKTVIRSSGFCKATSSIQHRRCYVVVPFACILLICGNCLADDLPATAQDVGHHSTVATTDGGIRDDELVDYVCQKIVDNGGKVKDVKVMAATCLGGGLLDDFQRAFGPGGACEGTPWVGASASAHDENALAASDEQVERIPEYKLGGAWTSAFAGSSPINLITEEGIIHNGSPTNNVMQDLLAARQNDPTGPNGANRVAPQVVSGNGGENILWNTEIAQHEAIVFGGPADQKGIHNDIENMVNALNEVWKNAPRNIQDIVGGTRQDLFDAIDTATQRLDEETQLLLYFDAHGGARYDFLEVFDALTLRIEDVTMLETELPASQFEAQVGMVFALDQPFPSLDMYITDCVNCSNWQLTWNGRPIDFPVGNPTGNISLPLPFYKIYPGMNYLQITPLDGSQTTGEGNKMKSDLGVLELSKLELNSGPIAKLETDIRQTPAQTAAYYDPNRNGEGVFVELLDNGKAVIYVFTFAPDGMGQSWMIGVGNQIGYGIISTEMFLPTGPSFGPEYDPDDLELNPYGGLAFGFPSCGTDNFAGVLDIPPGKVDGYDELLLSTNYRQLTEIVDCQTGESSEYAGYSGSWFDRSHNGEGIILQVLKSGTVLAQWFTFDREGNQMWIQGTGTIEDDVLVIDELYTTSGTAYGTEFNPDDINLNPWGTLRMEFTSCDTAVVTYDSSAGFGAGTLNMTRLTNLMGIPCEGGESD